MTKPCVKCGKSERRKPPKGRKIGACRPCNTVWMRAHREANPSIREYDRKYASQWNRDNPEAHRASCLKYSRANPHVGYNSTKRLRATPQGRLGVNLRNRLAMALRNNQRAGSAVRDLGCSIPEVKAHIESLWQPGMTWDNWGYGQDKWNIDHIIPLRKFDLTDREQFLRASHYTNLQPMWQPLNFSKGGR